MKNLKPSDKDSKIYAANLCTYLLYPYYNVFHLCMGLSLFLCAVTSSFGQCDTIYVDQSATLGANNGTSWTDAYTDLQDALGNTCAAPMTTIIHVAAGTYKPTIGIDTTISFVMLNNVEILGGYPSGGGTRDWFLNETILSGDIGVVGDSTDNSFHVINNLQVDSTAILDGFIISDGNAVGNYPNNIGGGMYNESSTPTIRNCAFSNNTAAFGGAAIYNYNTSSVSLANCSFLKNKAFQGGAIFNSVASEPTLYNCSFTLNTANKGGGMYNNLDCDPLLVNCSFSKNVATVDGGAIYNMPSYPTLINCILWDNENEIGGSDSMAVSYTIVKDTLFPGLGNLVVDPLFMDAANGDLSIQNCSPAKDVGDSSANNSSLDLAGNPRLVLPGIDLGAFEGQEICCSVDGIIYVDHSAIGANNGSSWANAFTDLQDALTSSCTNTTKIYIAQGTYKPTNDSDRTISFSLRNGLEILGGYETGGGDRDIINNETILSGDIGIPADSTDNSYHVIYNDTIDSSAVLDGVTITGSNADGSTYNSYGGGMYNNESSPTLTNCRFVDNVSKLNGGAMYNYESSPSLTNCSFLNNMANIGAGLYNNNLSNPDLIDCMFTQNTASNNGGAMYNNNSSSPILTNCSFLDNVAESGAGLYNNSNSSPELIDCTFSQNTASNNGGAMLNYVRSDATLSNCSFIDNSAGAGGGMYNNLSTPSLQNCLFINNSSISGGAVLNAQSGPTFTNCSFSKNTASEDGGGAYNILDSYPIFINCSFSLNVAGSSGGALHNYSSATPTLRNCILWGNSTELEYFTSLAPIVTTSIIEGGYYGAGNLDENPLFVDAANGDLSLELCSPAIDAGDNIANNTSYDLAGNPRIFNTLIDMGAFESQDTIANNLDIHDNPIPSNVYVANSSINSSGTVPIANDVTFRAQVEVNLIAGFEVEAGAVFLASIGDACMD